MITLEPGCRAGLRQTLEPLTSPGNAPSAITVGATTTHGTITRRDDEVAAFSSR